MPDVGNFAELFNKFNKTNDKGENSCKGVVTAVDKESVTVDIGER